MAEFRRPQLLPTEVDLDELTSISPRLGRALRTYIEKEGDGWSEIYEAYIRPNWTHALLIAIEDHDTAKIGQIEKVFEYELGY